MTTARDTAAPISGALGTQAAPRTLTTWKLTALLIATLTPLAVVSATLPLGLGLGGPTTALMFIAAGIVYAIFSVGYSAMVRRINRPGAFYNYIARGLGRPVGVGAAIMASVMYPIGLIGAWIAGAYASAQLLEVIGVHISWVWVFVALLVIIGFLVWRQIELSAVISGVVVAIEIIIILSFIIAVVAAKGAAAFPVSVISPSVFQYGSWPVAFIFAVLVFQGFESGALYAPEAKRPEKTVPRALYLTLLIMVGLLFLTSWVLTSLVGPANLQEAVAKAGFIGYVLGAVSQYLGTVGLWIFAIAAIVATLVVTAAVTNFMARYWNGLAKDDLLPQFLARTNKYGAPAVAAYSLMGLATLVAVLSLVFNIDPYTQITPIAFGIGAFGSTALLVVSSIAVFAYFLRKPLGERPNRWQAFIAPALAAVLMAGAAVIEVWGFDYITGVPAAWMRLLPLALLVFFVGGVVYAYWIKAKRANVYADIAAGDSAEEALEIRRRRLAAQFASAEDAPEDDEPVKAGRV